MNTFFKSTIQVFGLLSLSIFICCSSPQNNKTKDDNKHVVSEKKSFPKDFNKLFDGDPLVGGTRVAVDKLIDAVVFSNVMNCELNDHGKKWSFHLAKNSINELVDNKADLTMMVWEYHNEHSVEQSNPDIEFVTSISTSAREGFVVPDYSGVLSCNDLNIKRESFNDTIFVLENWDFHIKQAKDINNFLDEKMIIKECSELELLSDIERLYQNNKNFVASGWYPSVMFGLMELSLIDRPNRSASGIVDINIYARKDWVRSHPHEIIMMKKLRLNNDFYLFAIDAILKNRDDLSRAARVIYDSKKVDFERLMHSH
ncbi:hypothetical protein K4L44_14320 [Halosquirtibacter laminarini]|uniref:Uncharacterized protein n=1 Tax=Halosquirtibacter laminarini TaxID=3374600 RepID=A0AC61NHJ9_9BACT|nr:hypothetical protein K4L44_14320 [Prolixibacteraceae bacterium]